MAERVKPSRAYRSPTRQRQRTATRAAIVTAAAQCFTERGFGGTTISEVAKAADVSPESVYAIFGNKRELLRAAVETAAAGDDSGAGVVRESWLERVRAEPDQRRRFEIITEATRDALRRAAPLDEVVRAAAMTDPDIAVLQREHDQKRLDDIRMLIALLEEVGPLRMSGKDASDVMWAVSRSTDFYRALTLDRRWSHARAFNALNDLLARMLFED